MNTRPMHTKRLAATLCAAGLMLAAGAVHAADATGRGKGQSQYQQDIAACKSGATGQDPAACMREAGAARQLHFGHIALQAEGQGVWFRNIELKSLEEP